MYRVGLRSNALLVALMILTGMILVACGGAPAVTPAATEAPAAAAAPTEALAPTDAPTEAATEAATEAPTETAIEAPTEAAASDEQIVITHPQGETTLKRNPQTVVIFDYSSLDTLDQLGIPVAGVPQGTNVPAFLEKYKGSEYANVGTLFEPDFEKVNDLKPDLIIVATRSAAQYPELSKIAPTIDATVDQANFVESYKATMTNFGLIFGKEDEVASRLAAMDEAITRVKDKATTSGKTALIVMTTGGKVTAYGPGSRFGIIHDVLGVTPVVADIEAETHGDAISYEFIQEKNPDILYIIDRDAATGEASDPAEKVLDNDLVKSTNAFKNGKMVYLDPAAWYLANTGLGTVATIIEQTESGLD